MIEQKFSYDCAVASLAMFTGKTWDEIFLAFDKPTEGLPTNEVALYLWDNGFPNIEWRQCHGMPTIKSLVTVKSKNYPGKDHTIYFDGKDFYDPSPKEKYVSHEDVERNMVGFLSEQP